MYETGDKLFVVINFIAKRLGGKYPVHFTVGQFVIFDSIVDNPNLPNLIRFMSSGDMYESMINNFLSEDQWAFLTNHFRTHFTNIFRSKNLNPK